MSSYISLTFFLMLAYGTGNDLRRGTQQMLLPFLLSQTSLANMLPPFSENKRGRTERGDHAYLKITAAI